MISILKFTKGHNSIKNVDRVMVLDLCSSSGDALYLYQIWLEYLEGFQSYRADTVSISKFSKGQNSVKNVGGNMVLVLCTLIMLYICTKFHENISKVSELLSGQFLVLKFSKGTIP